MKFLATATVVFLLVLLCDGCEYHRRLEERRRQAAERLRERGRAALTSAQNQARADVRHSIYGSGSQHSDHSSSDSTSTTGRSREVYPVPRRSYSDHGSSHSTSTTGRSREVYPVPRRIFSASLPAGSKYCGGSQTYYCDDEATCIESENGVWKCQYETSHTISRYGQVPTVTRIGDGSTYTRRRTQYTPYIPHSGGNILRPEYNPFRRRTSTTSTCFSGLKRVDITSTSTSTTFKCVDIDECETESHGCSQTCMNTYGGFYCTCERGYKRNGKTQCVERNECKDFPKICGSGAVCSNTEGSYTCECIEGYQNNDIDNRCKEINECEEGDPCAEGEICFNTWGSYECDLPFSCPEGYLRPDASAITDQNCIREATTDQNLPGAISYKKIAVEARNDTDSNRALSSMTFSSTNIEYDHHFSVSVVEGGENFGYRRLYRPAYLSTNELKIEFCNKKDLEPNVNLRFTILITDRMTPKRRPYRTYGYGSQGGSYNRPGNGQLTTKRKVVMDIVPMVHGIAEDS